MAEELKINFFALIGMDSQNWTPDLLKDRLNAFDLGRVARARGLLVEKTGRGIFEVYSDSGCNDVALYPFFECSCGDRAWKDTLCKHIIAALLYVGHPEAREAAANLEQYLDEVALESFSADEDEEEGESEKGEGRADNELSALPSRIEEPSSPGREYLMRREERRFRPRERAAS